MDPILGLNNTSRNKTVKLSDLEALPDPYQTGLAVLYWGTAIIAVIANILAILILITKKRTSADLRKYLINLAITDILMASFSIPFTYSDFMYGNWRFHNLLCPITHFITICTVCVSIFTLTAIGIERYMAIIYPFKHCWFFESHTFYVICFIWILSVAISSPLLIYARALPFNYGALQLYDCKELWEGELSSMIYTIIIFIITFIIPFFTLTFLYGSICIKTFRHIHPGEVHTTRDKAQHRVNIKVVKMLVTLVSVFLICWLPIQIFNLVVWLFQELRYPKTKFHYYLYFGLYFSFHLLSTFHTFLNPFIYTYMSNNFNISDFRSFLDCSQWKTCFVTKASPRRRSLNESEKTSVRRIGINLDSYSTKSGFNMASLT